MFIVDGSDLVILVFEQLRMVDDGERQHTLAQGRLIERTTHTTDGTPIDYEHLYYRGDAFQYKVRVDRAPI